MKKTKLIKSMQKGKVFINNMEQVEQPFDKDTSIIVGTEEEADKIAFEMIRDLASKTWPDKNIIQYKKSDSQISKSKYDNKKEKQPINFKILSWIRENN